MLLFFLFFIFTSFLIKIFTLFSLLKLPFFFFYNRLQACMALKPQIRLSSRLQVLSAIIIYHLIGQKSV